MTTANESQKTLQTLQERKESLLLEADIRDLERALNVADLSSRLVEAEWNDIVDRREYLYDTPGFGYDASQSRRMSLATDRRNGSFAPFFESEADLATIRGVGRWLATAEETGVGLLNRLGEYAVSTGFTYEAEARQENSGVSHELIAQVDAILEASFERIQWEAGLELELFERSVYDGEFLSWVTPAEDGLANVRVVEPDYLTEPARARELEDWGEMECGLSWTWGVATRLNYHDRPLAYFIQWEGDAANWDLVNASEVVHFKNNVPRGVKRGLSDYFPVAQTLERSSKLLGNTLQGAAIQACIAYIREHATGTTQGGIEAVRAASRDLQRQAPTIGGGTRTLNYERFRPGKVIDVVGQKFTAGPLGQMNAQVPVMIIQAGLRAVGSRWAFPEYMISGDASNANFASTMVAGGPFDKATTLRQAKIKQAYLAIVWKVLGIAARFGHFKKWGVSTEMELRAQVVVNATPPKVAVVDKVKDEQVREIQKRNGVLSAKTWAAMADLDYDKEIENGAKESGPPTMFGGGVNPHQDPNQPAKAAVGAALESVKTSAEARAILAELYP